MSLAAHRTLFSEHSIAVENGQPIRPIRYLEAGRGQAVMFVTHDPEVTLTPAHELLAERYRVTSSLLHP